MIDSVGREEAEAVARATFGARARVESVREVVPIVEDGVIRRTSGSRNLSCVVKLAGVPERLVFRFHRGYWEDRYEHEAECYALLARHTGVRVPRIHAIDRSRRVVPTAYVVMEYLEGESWRYLTHPRNPALRQDEKEEVLRQTGRFYAEVHRITRPAAPGEQEVDRLRHMFHRLESAVREGRFPASLSGVERCLRALEGEPHFHNEVASLCLVDTEMYFRREAGRWELAFVLDPEWMEYGDPYSDLVPVLAGESDLWELNEPLLPDAAETARLPFFRGYESLLPVDFEALVRLPGYYQLGLWGNLLEMGPPEKWEWIRAAQGRLIGELIERIGRRAERRERGAAFSRAGPPGRPESGHRSCPAAPCSRDPPFPRES